MFTFSFIFLALFRASKGWKRNQCLQYQTEKCREERKGEMTLDYVQISCIIYFIPIFFPLTNRKSQKEKSSQTKNLTQHKTLCSSIVRKTSEMSSSPAADVSSLIHRAELFHRSIRRAELQPGVPPQNWAFCPINTAWRGFDDVKYQLD